MDSWRGASSHLDDIWADIESSQPKTGKDSHDQEKDPGSTYQLTCLRRANERPIYLQDVVYHSKEMFLLQVIEVRVYLLDARLVDSACSQYSASVKQAERQRLEKVALVEEAHLQTAEAELRLAQQAFDQFLQENDKKAIEAVRR